MQPFSLDYNIFEKGVKLNVKFSTETLNTRYIPGLYEKLFKLMPSVLKTECFNPDDLPFSEEVKKTEIGHLFEHILLEFMALQKEKFSKNFSIAGRTFWNAKARPEEYRIEIYCSLCDFPIFVKSIKPTCSLVNYLLQTNRGGLPGASVLPAGQAGLPN